MPDELLLRRDGYGSSNPRWSVSVEPRKVRLLKTAVPACVLLLAVAGCDAPFTVPSTRALESGAGASLASESLEVTGSYTDGEQAWTIDVQLARPISEYLTIKSASVSLEAIVVGGETFYRGSDFLAQHLGKDPASLNLLKAAGHAWWKGVAYLAPNLADFTDPARFGATFFGSNVAQRTDHVAVDGVDAADLSGPRADVYVAEASPYQLVRVDLKRGVSVDGLTGAVLRYGNFNHGFNIAPPADVIDFSDLSTLPPNYTVTDVDTRACGTPCVVSAHLTNLGGIKGASAPSTVAFTMTDGATGAVLGSCTATVQPDVGYNSTTTVSCTINGLSGQAYSTATVTATPTNPGRA